MAETSTPPAPAGSNMAPKDWVQILARYRDPDDTRSAGELAITLLPFVALWSLAWWALSFSVWISLSLGVLAAPFLLRLFVIQHDCGHGSFFRNRHVADWTGRALGVLTLTPYDVWRRSHSLHHATHGNLDRRGMGDVMTLTVEEYHALSWRGRLAYRFYRNPVVMFGLGPTYLFMIQNRLPLGMMSDGWRYWISAMVTNLMIVGALSACVWWGGFGTLLFIFLPSAILAASAGVWLFYIQHQFEEAHWDKAEDWALHDAALLGSSHYVLPGVLRWFTANIGVHHVHHLYSRIPFYRLPEVLRDHSDLATAQRMTLGDSLKCLGLHLWDARSRRLLSFAEARRLAV